MLPKIELHGVSKVYPTSQGAVEALKNVELSIEEGEFLCILGPSGCGKSTLLRILAGLYEKTGGDVIVRVANNGRRPANAVVFQEYALFPWRTVADNITFGLEMRGVSRQERRAIANHYLAKTGLTQFAGHYPHELSGGMKQRVALARALANDPEVLLMDEPFGAADAQTRALLQMELLRIWGEEKKTVVYVTHSIEEAVILGDRVALMTAPPGQVKAIFPVDLPRPRELKARTTVAFNRLAEMLWEALIEEVNKTLALEQARVDHRG
jgi:NitT/TauT family transport system ATP-binding protein